MVIKNLRTVWERTMFRDLFKAFEDKGYSLFFVGGCVRDYLLGKVPNDYDFTTNAKPEQIKEILESSGYKYWPIGEKFGTIAAIAEDQEIEITTHRKDVTSGRHPEVMFTDSLTEDLERRDFTINSMAMDGQYNIVDPFNGRRDLDKRIIKTTGSPVSRFGEDPLRMLRAVRFVSQLGFNVNSKTRDVINTFAHAIMSISRERWQSEMNKLLMGRCVSKSLELLLQTRLLGYIIPEVFALTLPFESKIHSKNLWKHTKMVVENSILELDVRWAALLHDIAKPQTRMEDEGNSVIHFFQHEYVGSEMAESTCRRLRMSSGQKKSICGLIAMHHKIGDIVSRRYDPPVSSSGLRRIARECEERGCDLNNLIALFAADCTSKKEAVQERQSAHVELLKKAVSKMIIENARPKLPKGIGHAIMKKYDLSPGPEVKKIKDVLDEMLLDGKINSEMDVGRIFEEYEKL